MIDIIVLTCNRLPFLKQTIEAFETRLKTPFRLIVVNNNSKDGTHEYLGKLLEKSEYLMEVIDRKEGEELPSSYAFNHALQYVRSEFFITTQDDIVIPDLEPDILQRMQKLMEDNPECGALSLRNQDMRRKPKEGEDIMYNVNACCAWFRMQRLSDFKRLGFGKVNRWEATRIMERCREAGKKGGIAADLWCNDLGLEPNRGYPDWYLEEVKGKRGFDWITAKKKQRELPEIDLKTNEPICQKKGI